MPDYRKRNTLKVLGAGGVLAATGSVSAASQLAGGVGVRSAAHGGVGAGAQHDALELLVIDSSSQATKTVIIGNKTPRAVSVSGFLPGTIVYDDQSLDINALFKPLLADGGVYTLEAGRSISISGGNSDHSYTNGHNGEYLWAQEATTTLGADTTLITLAAFMHQSLAIVYPVMEPLRMA